MDQHSISPRPMSLRLAILGSLGLSSVPISETAVAEPANNLVEEVTVVGSRRANAVDVVAPVDVISAEQFQSVGAPDMDNMLRTWCPLITSARYDVSGSYGSSEVEFLIYNTVNASLGPDTPTRFKPGVNHQTVSQP